MISLNCRVEQERYYSNDSNFGVYVMYAKMETCKKIIEDNYDVEGVDEVFKRTYFDDEYEFVIAGNMQRLEKLESYYVEGNVEYNKKYKSYQIKPSIVNMKVPNSVSDSKKFLKSILTDRQSDILLSVYPDIVKMIIEEEYIDLSKLNGIGEKSIISIKEKVADNYLISDLLVMLSPLGISFNKIKKISELSDNPNLIKKQITDNPYILMKINGLGFKNVDKIALKINPKLKISDTRSKAFINSYLEEISNSKGHTWVYRNEIVESARAQIRPCLEKVKSLISEIETDMQYFVFEDRIGLRKNYNHEESIFRHLSRVNNSIFEFNELTEDEFDIAIEEVEKDQGFKFTDQQRDAIKSVNNANNNVLVISGNAGSGKTSVIKGILNILNRMKSKNEQSPFVSQCALSARASIRMQEATGVTSSTIHSLLGWSGVDGFSFNEYTPLPSDVIVADELSMNNISICDNLFRAVKSGAKIILVFDHAQLPPIGAGAVAYDLLESSSFSKFKFTKVHRQAEASGILSGANLVRKQKMPIKELKKTCSGELKDMYYVFSKDREKMRDYAIKQYFNILKNNDVDDASIIVPRKNKVINSTEEINKIIQSKLIPHGSVKELNFGLKCFRIGDKVIERKNDKDRNIFNGEVGYVESIKLKKDGLVPQDTLIVKFRDYVGENEYKYINYSGEDFNGLNLAYALTVHSFQGSQCENVITILDNTHTILLDCTMLYTAMTRAKSKCMIIAEPTAFNRCVKTNKTIKRHTFLKGFLTGKLKLDSGIE